MKKYLTIILFIYSTTIINAQRPANMGGEIPKGSISGNIIDKNTSQRVLYASVALYSMRDSSLVSGIMSGENGAFTLEDLNPGKYYLLIKFIGYERYTIKNIMLRPPNMNLNLNQIFLVPSYSNLQGVEITAEKTFVEYKIDRKVVNVGQDLNSSGGTAIEALENVPSVIVDIDGNVALRGSGSFTVLVNGRPTPLKGSDALQQIPVSAIKNIEIITNPSAKYDPDGMTGIINVVLKENIKQGLSGIIDFSVASFNQYNFNTNLSYNIGKFNFFIGGRFDIGNNPVFGEGQLSTTFGGVTSYRHTQMNRGRSRDGYILKGGLEYKIDDNDLFSIEGSYNESNSLNISSGKIHEYTLPQTVDVYTISENPGFNSRKYYKFTLNWEHKLDKLGSKIQSFAYYSNGSDLGKDSSNEYLSDYDMINKSKRISGNTSEETEEAPDYRFNVDLTKYLKNKNRIEAGLQARLRPEYHVIKFSEYDSNDILITNPLYCNDMHFTRDIYSAYFTYSGEYKTFGYQFGLRGEYTYRNVFDKAKDYSFKINRLDYFPTVHFSKKFKNDHQILLSYSRRIERPDGHELEPGIRYMNSKMIRVGNPELLPEYMDNIELSYQKSIKQSSFSLEGYYHTTKNVISRYQSVDTTGLVSMTFGNLDRDHSAGVELMLNVRMLKWLNFNISGNYYYYLLIGRNAILGDVNTSSDNFDMRGNLNMDIATNTKFQINGFYNGPSVTAQGKRAASFITSASIRQDFFNKKLSLTFSARDIFNTMKFDYNSIGENFINHNKFYRKSPVLTLHVSYKINNYKEKRSMNESNGFGGGDVDM
ncbi:MAG: hypothetical protein AUJ98_02080 [Bacteroidetes bacterium CG2_30_33_31]|nr:MAG: hypothetical protein AUJ98_02080 [Bacteroidetes bacterium CG2_30_33_31]